MDKEMMRALQEDAAKLEAMGAGEQPLAFEGLTFGMRLTNAAKDLWEVYDSSGVVCYDGLSLGEAEKMLNKLAFGDD